MIRFTGEGEDLKPGLNIYRWSQRRQSIGFKLVWAWKGTDRMWAIRYAPKSGRLHTWKVKITPEQKAKLDEWTGLPGVGV